MTHRLGYAIVLTILSASAVLGACDDSPDERDDATAGKSSAGSKTGGTSSGGTSSGGTSSGGGHAGSAQGGTAGSSGGGSANGGEGGDLSLAGAGPENMGGMAGMDAGGAAGAGGAENPTVVYACGTSSIVHKLCSALAGANCPLVNDCADCVTSRTADRAGFEGCAACLAEYDAYFQCGIDAYESGNVSAGIECFDGYGADLNDTCAEHLNQAISCQDYFAAHNDTCPDTWPQ